MKDRNLTDPQIHQGFIKWENEIDKAKSDLKTEIKTCIFFKKT